MATARTSGPAPRRTAAQSRPTKDELEMFSRVRRASLILDELQRESLEELDLSFVEYSALRVIDMEGPPYQMSPSRMAELLVRTTGGMTKIVDRLERRGLVDRVRGNVDRRSVLVVLTDDGKAMCRKASAAYRVGRKRVLTHIDRKDVAAINAHLDMLLEAFELALPEPD
jgi:DNA-binding MarR family transcriptional regulator